MNDNMNLKDQLMAKQQEFAGSEDIFAITALTNPGYISSARSIMFTNHTRQAKSPLHPDKPYVFTNHENSVGRHSSGYKEAKANLRVLKKVNKFNELEQCECSPYVLFVYNEDNNTYDVLEKKDVENLTEKFGYQYNNEFMDSLKEGDEIPEGSIIYKSNSYDEYMNYGYGKNATFMYTCDTRTIEDAILIRKGYAEEYLSLEVETVMVSANENDIFLNLYGEGEEYKIWPDIGEHTKGKKLCAIRRLNNRQQTYSLKADNMKQTMRSDKPSFISGTVVDINIYCNKELDEIPNNSFNTQIKHYVKMQIDYYTEIYEFIKELKDSGCKCSNDMNFLYRKAKDVLDPNAKYRGKDGGAFSNMNIEFVVKRNVGVYIGQKLTGRYGNKGVVAEIVEDDEMPFLENGKIVDIQFNTLGVINRLNSFQLFEQSLTFICERVRERMRELPTLEEKAELFFDIIGRFSERECKELKEYYNKMSEDSKQDFIDDVIRNGMYIHIPPMWETGASLYDRILKTYIDHPWIQPYTVYINKFGRKIKVMRKLVIGKMYILKLKQSSKKGFSSRSTGPINAIGVPSKTTKAKNHECAYSDTPVTNGDQELNNVCVTVDPYHTAKMHMYHRSSPTARRKLGKALAEQNIRGLEDFPVDPDHKNRNVEKLKVMLKTLGLTYQFKSDYHNIDIVTSDVETHYDEEGMFIGTELQYRHKQNRAKAIEIMSDSIFIGTNEEYENKIEEIANELDDIIE